MTGASSRGKPRRTGFRIDAGGRECAICGKYQPWREFHRAGVNQPHGRSSYCRTCIVPISQATQRRWRAANPEKEAERNRAWRLKNPGLRQASSKRNYDQTRGRERSGQPWTDREDRMVLGEIVDGVNWDHRTDRNLSDVILRGVSAIQQRRSRLRAMQRGEKPW